MGTTGDTSDDTNPRGRSSLWAADRDLVGRVSKNDKQAVEAFILRMRCVPRFLAIRNRQYGEPPML